MFGINSTNATDNLKNTMILVAKQYIYASKCMTTIPNLNQLFKRVYKQMLVEKYIAEKNNKVALFEMKWGLLNL